MVIVATMGALATPASAAVTTGASALDLANAMLATSTPLTIADTTSFTTSPPLGTPTATADSGTSRASFPLDGSTYAVLTTGDANLIQSTENTAPNSGANDNGATPPGRGNTAFDVSTLKVDINVPGGYTCLRVNFRFLSEEFPEYVGSQYNDAFVAELDNSNWTTDGSTIASPNNFAFDPDGNAITINSTGFTHMSAAESAGTTYDGATPLLIAQTPLETTGSHSVYFSIFDQGDHVFDSAVLLDALSVGTQSGNQCLAGAKPVANASLTVNTGTIGARFGQMGMSSINYAGLTADSEALTALATAPVGHGPVGHGPVGHGPVGHGPVGHGPIIGPDSPFRFTPLSALPLSKVPPILIASVPIAQPPGPWTTVLNGLSPQISAPFQTVNLSQVAGSSTVHVGDLDLGSTVFGALSPASFLFGNVSLSDLALTPPNGFTGSNLLAEVELAGTSIASLPITGITLKAKAAALAGTPLGTMGLDNIDLSLTSVKDVKITAVPSAVCDGDVMCTDASKTLTQIQDAGHISLSATVNDLLGSSDPAVAALTFGGLMPGIIDVTNFPFENASLDDILQAAPFDPAQQLIYTASADIACPVQTGTQFALTLASGFRYVPGSPQFTFGGGSPISAAEPSSNGGSLVWTVPSSAPPDGPCGPTDTVKNVALKFKAEPGPDLGTFTTSLTVDVGSVQASVPNSAPVTTTDNFPSGSVGSAITVAPDTLYTDPLPTGVDIDYFNLPVAATDVGRTVRVSASHMPDGADYDITLYGVAASSSLRGAPVGHGPVGHGPVGHGPLSDDGECVPAGTVLQPQTLQDVPQAQDNTVAIRGYSTNRGLGNEFACTVVQPADVGHGITVQFSTYNDNFNPTQSALLSFKLSPLPPQLSCVTVPSEPDGVVAGPALPAPGSVATDTQTLFLVNARAIGRFYGAAGESTVVNGVTDSSFLSMPNVKGVVLSVDNDEGVAAAYSAWYDDYCSPAKANDVVRAINGLVDSYRNASPGLPNLKHIVLVGPDAVLPSARIQELVNLGSESTEAANIQFNSKDNPASRALLLGNYLSDDPYFSFQPVPWLTTNVYPPSVAGGRLVETPADVAGAIAQYTTTGGILDPKTRFTTGYDFFGESATAKDDALSVYPNPKNGPTTYLSQINESWTRDDIADSLNAQSQPGIDALDAHADQYRLEPASTFHSTSNITDGDLYKTSDLAASALAAGTLAFSMGCHAGLSVADVWVSGSDPRSLDWAQAFAGKTSLFAGNTGFGYGDTNLTAYSEKLTLLMTQGLDGTMSVGQAAANAKQQYYANLGVWGVFDAKSVEEYTMYGLPMYVVGTGGQVAGPTPPTSPPDLTTDPDTELPVDNISFSGPLYGDRKDTDDGSYYEGPSGAVQVAQFRPTQPITAAQDLTQLEGGPRLHGAVMLSFTRSSVSPFNPLITVPTLAPGSFQPEPRITDSTFPSGFVSTLHQDTIKGPRDTLIAFGGKFVSDEPGQTTGKQLLFSDATVRAYFSSSEDDTIAIISTLSGEDLEANASFTLTTQASDVAAAYITYRLAGSDSFQSAKMSLSRCSGGTCTWVGSVNTSTNKVAEYFGQLVTTAGNTSVSTFKALFGTPVPPPPVPGGVTISVKDNSGATAAPNEFGWYKNTSQPLKAYVTSNGGTETFTLTVDSIPPPVPSPATVSGEGPHTVTYTGTGGSSGHFDVNIDTKAPILSPSTCPTPSTFYLNAEGGHHTFTLTASDPTPGSGLNAAASVLSGTVDTTTVGTKTLTFTAVDYASNSVSMICSYSVQYVFSGFFSPVDNQPTVNLAKAGQSIPIKWRLTDANGVAISDTTSFASVTTTPAGSCGGSSDVIETYGGSSGLQYLGNGNWQFNWVTPKSYAGLCKTMTLNLKDGVVPLPGQPRTAHFQFK